MLDIKVLSNKGFMFLWILGNQINMACKMLNKWGYDLIDLIIWVKTKRGKVYLSHGYYLMHSYEICLVGYKCPTGSHVEYFSKVSNNIIFSEVRGKSQKPDEIYEIIEMMMPGSKKLEIFARNNNLRKGWFSIGNQLGEEFHQWSNHVNCDQCNKPISLGLKRYKSKVKPNFDLCQKCFKKGEPVSLLLPDESEQSRIQEEADDEYYQNKQEDQMVTKKRNKSLKKYNYRPYSSRDFFILNNLVSETVLHKYYSCNVCHMNPIWGLRFTCLECPNYDLCEGCYDQHLKKSTGEEIKQTSLTKHEPSHPKNHQFHVEEMQKLSLGFQTHLGEKCASCYKKPIIGVCYKCSTCSNLSLCQKCFFKDKNLEVKNRKSHKPDHSWEFFIKPQKKGSKTICSWCEEDGSLIEYRCDICFDFGLCSLCYMKKSYFKINKATTHKAYHTFTKINAEMS
jgi:mRNA (2'-O-methyladenosine-N6-)-methyltransferase